MKRLTAYGCALFLAAGAAWSTESRISYSASAYGLDRDELLYVEKHVETWREGRLTEREVRYEDPTGRLIAEKTVSYGETLEAPSFEMTDFRFGLREGAEVAGERVVLFSGPPTERLRSRSVERPKVAVIDAGFDAFMRENFDSIVDGASIEFDFAVPALRRFVSFELIPRGEVTYRGQRAHLIKMRPASALLRLIVDPIDLTYSPDGRLLEFEGLANVLDEDGDRYEARIVFDYRSDEVAPALIGGAE